MNRRMREGGTTGRAKAEQSRDRGNFIVEGRGEERRDSCRRAEAEAVQGGNESPSSTKRAEGRHTSRKGTRKNAEREKKKPKNIEGKMNLACQRVRA